MATIQRGATVMRNGRIVSLAESDARSNAMKTTTLSRSRTAYIAHSAKRVMPRPMVASG